MEPRIIEDDLSGEAVRALVAFHLTEMHRNSPACAVHALPADKLREPGVTFWSAWAETANGAPELAAMGALKQLDAGHGEIKSMRAAPAFRRQGLGEAMLRHLVATARGRGYARVSLETGNGEAFAPARSLYRKHGFVACGPFADYTDDPFSYFMMLELAPASG